MRDLVFGELEFDVDELEAYILQNRDEEEIDFSSLRSVEASAQSAMLSSVKTGEEEVSSPGLQTRPEEVKSPV